ncbi:uncharacterized protein LOC114129897 isoform X2 [Aphis gossypii]|uniref:uncharacterized protein LOC114129897 isoform X2 n=1 Tax=Aphis gossypii TaxID=80765 RepID=UPI0021596CF6|nr:uncharacterized protein LOC114129897 isoform X2 [Aphis gossypii]
MFEVMNTQNTTGQIRTLIGTSKYRRCIIITYKAIRKLLKWTDCKGSCGETGYMSRYRSTTSSDVLCEFNHEWKTCNILGCTIRNYTEAAEGNELKTRELNYILEITRNTNQIFWNACFSDHCNYNALKNEFTNNTDRLWNALLCVKHNLGCPVKGGWSKWSSWSKCTATCGFGMQYRLRYCDHPCPSRTSLNCSGNYIEFKNCFGKSCTAKTNGTWCKWMKWSECSVQQGNGIIVRKRFCRSSNNNSVYMSCSGPHTEIGRCYVPGVDGGWSEWLKWSPCSTTCDRGIRYRLRSCSRPEPESSGRHCEGETVQTNICYVGPCKGPPIMVTTFDKQSHIKYAATETSTTLLHVVVQFYPFGMSGTILRRFDNDCDGYCNSIQLNLIDFRLILIVDIDGCNVTLQSTSTINFGWNEVIFSITKNKVELQLNNHQTSTFIKCMIWAVNLDQVMIIGEDFEGYIKKFDVNFMPYALTINEKLSDTMYIPYTTFNTVFELSEEQSYSDLFNTIKIPCPQPSNNWKLELYLRFEILANGNFISTRSTAADYMSVEINNDVFKLKIKLDEYFDEVSIKFEYIDSSWIHLEIEQHDNSWCLSVNDNKRSLMMPDEVFVELCEDHMYIGNFQENQNSTQLRGIIGYLKLNDDILNPNDFIINSKTEYNALTRNLSDTLYNEVTMTSENDVIELNCIFISELKYEDLDIVWLKSYELGLHRIDCNISHNCAIITNKHVSQITIFSKSVHEDYFYLCISMKIKKIMCIYGVTTLKNNFDTVNDVMKTFIILGRLIALLTIFFLMFTIKNKIKRL